MSHDPALDEQLSALMDGELPPDQARFLLRRLAHDPALRARWGRWQVASAQWRGLPQHALAPGLPEAVSAALSAPRPRLATRWVAAASAAVFLAFLMPRGVVTDAGQPAGWVALAEPRVAEPAPAVLADAPEAPAVAPAAIDRTPVSEWPLQELPGRRPWPQSPLPGEFGRGALTASGVGLLPPPPRQAAGSPESAPGEPAEEGAR